MTDDEMMATLLAVVNGGATDPRIARADPGLVRADVKIESSNQTLDVDARLTATNSQYPLENFSVSVYLRPGQKSTIGAYGSGVCEGQTLRGGTRIHMIMPTTKTEANYTVACFVRMDHGQIELWMDTKSFEFKPT